MDITKYVSVLLYDYECVVIPGLGGFIVNDTPATVNRINHQFKPPFRKIILNVHLKANDGLLINYVANARNIPFQQAQHEVELFVNEVREVLERGKSFNFEGLGTIRYDQNQSLIFEQDTSVNYNPNAYGLSGFVSPPVRRVSEEEKLRSIISPKKPAVSKRADRRQETLTRKKKRVFVPFVLIIMAIMLLAVAGWGILNPGQVKFYWEHTAALIPAAYHGADVKRKANVINEARYIPRALVESDKEISAKLAALEEKDEMADAKALAVDAPSGVETDAANSRQPAEVLSENIKQPPSEINPPGPLYYIIAGSFSDFDNANRLVNALRQKGYQAQIADTSSNSMYRVAYTGIKNLHEAKQALFAIRQKDNAEAWLFRK